MAQSGARVQLWGRSLLQLASAEVSHQGCHVRYSCILCQGSVQHSGERRRWGTALVISLIVSWLPVCDPRRNG